MDINWNVQNRMPVRMQRPQGKAGSVIKGIGKLVGNLLDPPMDNNGGDAAGEQDSEPMDNNGGNATDANTGLNIAPVEADVNSKNEDDSGNKTANASKAVSAVAKIISLL